MANFKKNHRPGEHNADRRHRDVHTANQLLHSVKFEVNLVVRMRKRFFPPKLSDRNCQGHGPGDFKNRRFWNERRN